MLLISSKCLSSERILAFLADAVEATMQSPVGTLGCVHFNRPASRAISPVRSAIRRPLLASDKYLIFASSTPRFSQTYRTVSAITIVGRIPFLFLTKSFRCLEVFDLTFSSLEKKYSTRNRESITSKSSSTPLSSVQLPSSPVLECRTWNPRPRDPRGSAHDEL